MTYNILYISFLQTGKRMKIHEITMFLLLVAVALTSCTGNAAEFAEEGMVFTEDEVKNQPAEGGMDFSDEETMDLGPSEGFDFTDDEAGDESEEMVFDEDEVEPLPDPPDEVLPQEGTANWQITHDPGTIICPNVNIPIEAIPPETVSILVGEDADTLVVSGFDGGPQILFFLIDSGPGGSLYRGFFTPPGASEEVQYEMLFTNLSDPSSADFLLGTISAEEQGCKVSRSFYGNRLN
jgi:hypothetical protein